MKKSHRVQEQKGPIKINTPTQKSSTYAQKAVEDFNNDLGRKKMGTMVFQTPRQ